MMNCNWNIKKKKNLFSKRKTERGRTSSLLASRLGQSSSGEIRVANYLWGREQTCSISGENMEILQQENLLHALPFGDQCLLHRQFRRHQHPSNLRRDDFHEAAHANRKIYGCCIPRPSWINRNDDLRVCYSFCW